MRDSHYAIPGHLERPVTSPIALERQTAAVVSVSVDLDDDPLPEPCRVYFVTRDHDIDRRSRQACVQAQIQEPALKIGACIRRIRAF